jgi:scyllo-inositol 2-dehydrogenase (NADP+)
MGRSIVVGITSFGMSGRIFHAPLLTHHKNFEIKRIVERSRDEARFIYPDVLISRSLENLLQDDEIELVVVNTPDAAHMETATKCLEAGKHVVVEKPFTQTAEQGVTLLCLAQRKGKVLSVFHNRRWDGDFLTVRKIVEKHMLGRLVEYEAHFDRYKNFIQTDSWKERASEGTGVLFNLGSHLIDQALVLFGMPEAVTGHLKIIRNGGEVDDWFEIRLHYSGVNVLLKSSLLVKEPGPRYLLHGTQGSFLKWGLDPQEEALKQGKNPNDPEWGREAEKWWGTLNVEHEGIFSKTQLETLPGNYSAFYDNLYDSIVHGKELAVKPEEALNVIRIIEAVKESSSVRKTIMV